MRLLNLALTVSVLATVAACGSDGGSSGPKPAPAQNGSCVLNADTASPGVCMEASPLDGVREACSENQGTWADAPCDRSTYAVRCYKRETLKDHKGIAHTYDINFFYPSGNECSNGYARAASLFTDTTRAAATAIARSPRA